MYFNNKRSPSWHQYVDNYLTIKDAFYVAFTRFDIIMFNIEKLINMISNLDGK